MKNIKKKKSPNFFMKNDLYPRKPKAIMIATKINIVDANIATAILPFFISPEYRYLLIIFYLPTTNHIHQRVMPQWYKLDL